MFSLSDLRSSFDATERSSRTYTTIEATALHESVPPDRWCITRSDLRYLGQEVRKAIQCGEIRPPDDGSDDFQASDTRYGPSIYTVNKQHIMPVTERFGKVSWALLQHPDGLDCDLFISHAWQEGVFEFLAKVLHSWPADARHAWCCMLANPQNLDIGSLLQSPISSPFALALKASTYVLVVPNHRCSIYTRLDHGTGFRSWNPPNPRLLCYIMSLCRFWAVFILVVEQVTFNLFGAHKIPMHSQRIFEK